MTKTAIVSFNSGAVTPEIDARFDIEKYSRGCRRLENMIPDMYGNATKRPGTELIVAGNGSGCYYKAPAPDPAKTSISTPQELQDMEDDLTADYELLNNIDMTGFDWTPIGQSADFEGTLDGRFFTISNLTISSDEGEFRLSLSGLFGRVNGLSGADNAIIENVIMTNVSIDTEGSSGNPNAGCLIGAILDDVTVRQCKVSGAIFNTRSSGRTYLRAGGLIGTSQASNNRTTTIQRCSAEVTLTSKGLSESLDIIGGFVGIHVAGAGPAVFNDCYAIGSIVAGTPAPGNDPTAYGGFVGSTSTANATNRPIFTNCYAATSMWKSFVTDKVGGFTGNDSFATPRADSWVDCFWDTTISVSGTDGNSTGKTTSQMETESTFTNWDFTDVWKIDAGNDYPRHRWTETSDIRGTCKRL